MAYRTRRPNPMFEQAMRDLMARDAERERAKQAACGHVDTLTYPNGQVVCAACSATVRAATRPWPERFPCGTLRSRDEWLHRRLCDHAGCVAERAAMREGAA